VKIMFLLVDIIGMMRPLKIPGLQMAVRFIIQMLKEMETQSLSLTLELTSKATWVML